MRPYTAGTKKSEISSARAIWKKYQNLKNQNNQQFCLKTLSQILEFHQFKEPKQSKKDIYYHKIGSPRVQTKQAKLAKQLLKKKNASIFQRNPNMKKTSSFLNNNFFSSKQIGKQNNSQKTISIAHNINKIMKTQFQISSPENKFLPYRQQRLSIIKNSKILAGTNEYQKQQSTNSGLGEYTSTTLNMVPKNIHSAKQIDNNYFNNKIQNNNYIQNQFQKKQEYKSNNTNCQNNKNKENKEKSYKENKLQKYKNQDYNNDKFQIQKWEDFNQDIKNLSYLMVSTKNKDK